MSFCLDPCPGCPRLRRPVPWSGPRDADIMLIGEAPGKQENAFGRPFVGKTGVELDEQYLPLSGLIRQECYVTNTIKCWPEEDRPPLARAKSCAEYHLRREMARVNPRLVVLMGGIAYDALVANGHSGHPLAMVQGYPLHKDGEVSRVNLLGWEGPVFPMYHPALGLHKTTEMVPLRDGFRRLGEYLRGDLLLPTDGVGRPTYELIHGKRVAKYISLSARYTACDTESVPTERGWAPWCLTFSQEPGTGYMIRTDDWEGMTVFQEFLGTDPVIVFHNAAHDLRVFAQLGLYVRRFHDTMERAYLLGNQPQSLKMLAYRICGMEMQEFDDVVMPYANLEIAEYIAKAADCEWPKPEPVPTGESCTVNCPECKGQGMVGEGRGKQRKYRGCRTCSGEGKISKPKLSRPWGVGQYLERMIGDWVKDQSVSMLERWRNWDQRVTSAIEEKCGRFPWPSIAQVPLDKAIYYACRDADATLRCWPELIRLSRELRKNA